MGPDKTQFEAEGGLDLSSYVRLRTILDSLELGAIKYMLNQREGRGGRFDELNDRLMPLVDWVWKKAGEAPAEYSGAMEIDCPEGYIDCHGVCVPYPCPDVDIGIQKK